MTYELVLKLKEAGFPQFMGDFKGEIIEDGGAPEGEEPMSCYCPTLSELIEAVGIKGFVMWELNGMIYAGKDDTAGRGENYYDDYPHPLEKGSTPEEAVANLWLSINTKINDKV